MSRRVHARRCPGSTPARRSARGCRAMPGGGRRRRPGSPIPNGRSSIRRRPTAAISPPATGRAAFGHWRQIRGFWSGLCAVNRAAAASGGSGDYKVMLYTIGLSFSAEMAVKGPTRTRSADCPNGSAAIAAPTMRINARVWVRYGDFMHETPWYRFPFGQAVSRPVVDPSGGAPLPPLGASPRAQRRIWRQGRLCRADRLGLGRNAWARRADPALRRPRAARRAIRACAGSAGWTAGSL